MRAFILTDKDGQIKDRDMLDLYDGFLALDVPIQFYTETAMHLNMYHVTKEDVVGGHINMCHIALGHLRVDRPCLLDYPRLLWPFLHREAFILDFKTVKESFDQLRGSFKDCLFVKPVSNKQFAAGVYKNASELVKAVDVPDNTPVWVSEVVKFESEYRVYVYENKIVDVFRYWGDNWKDNIDGQVVDRIVATAQLEPMPVFYSIDVGLINKSWAPFQETALVEVNDGYALGNYGLSPKQYAEMSMARWRQIVSKV